MKSKHPRHHHTWRTAALAVVAVVAMMAACQTDDGSDDGGQGHTLTLGAQVEPMVTRAGRQGPMTDKTLTETGFGVFSYDEMLSAWPKNKQITYQGAAWPAGEDQLDVVHVHPSWNYYTGIDWPKDQRLSLLAYAPYVASPEAGEPGITAISAGGISTTTVGYQVADKPSKSVDLMWGIRSEAGVPWLDTKRDDCGGLVIMGFRHALFGLAYRVQAMIDDDNLLNDLTDVGLSDANSLIGKDIRITLKSITLKALNDGKIYKTGTLNLNNTVGGVVEPWYPLWSVRDATFDQLTLDDEIDVKLKDPGGTDFMFMNEDKVTGAPREANTQEVIKDGNFFMLIPPAEKQDYRIDVEYYITYRTASNTFGRLDHTAGNATGLGGAGVVTIKDWKPEPGIKYYLNLVIGLKTLQLTVDVATWEGEVTERNILVEHGTSASQSLARQHTARP